jgi:DNA-binding response OmpR family regulator
MQLAAHCFDTPCVSSILAPSTLINVPASPQSSGTAGSIVLVEEYGALAVAIGSALKKFAPGFSTQTVRSLVDAESAIAAAKPDLMVVDFDPPTPGALEFFTRLRSTAPSTRVLLIAAAPVGRLAELAAAPGAFQFVDKPFDLRTLGAGFAAVLGNGATEPRTRRTLRDLAVRDVIPLQCLAGITGILKIDASEGRSGEIQFTAGQISHAETTETDGPEALCEMLRWRSPRFKQPKRKPRAAKTVEGTWSTVLLAAASKAAEEDEPLSVEPAMVVRENVGGGNKIVVIDDTEMLLVFVEDILSTADPTLEIFTAATGAGGVERVAAIKPRLVLLDFSLPDFNGDEVCKRLLDNSDTAAIPVIMMSGHVPEMAASARRYRNIVATVAKPFLSHVLVDVVTQALANPAQFAVPPPAPVASPPPSPAVAVATPEPVETSPKAAEPPRRIQRSQQIKRRREATAIVDLTLHRQNCRRRRRVPRRQQALHRRPRPHRCLALRCLRHLTPSAQKPSIAPPPLFAARGGGQVAVAPPPPISMIAPAPRPTVQRALGAVMAAQRLRSIPHPLPPLRPRSSLPQHPRDSPPQPPTPSCSASRWRCSRFNSP